MLYSITEAAKRLQVSRVTVYNKLDKLPELKAHVKVQNNTKYIDDTGLEIIRLSMVNLNECKESTPTGQDKPLEAT